MSAIDLNHPALVGRTGAGVSVAVIDSGINPVHSHIARVVGGVAITPEPEGDAIDRIGHGTAVAAVIHERAPAADLYAVKVFDRELATTADALVHAIDWSVGKGIRLINLSLGTRKATRQPMFAKAVERAREGGTLLVSACEDEDALWYPGSMPGVVGVLLDWDCPRTELRLGIDSRGVPAFRASGYPRPLPGVAPERNLWGISFAVANVTAMLALALEGREDIRESGEIFEMLSK